MNGPQLYDENNPVQIARRREEKLKRIQEAQVRQIHRRRRTTILAVFAIIFVFLGVQIGIKLSQESRLNQQVQTSKTSLTKLKHEHQKLTAKRNNLKDPDYVAKLIRSKFYYSKANEKIYHVPEGNDN